MNECMHIAQKSEKESKIVDMRNHDAICSIHMHLYLVKYERRPLRRVVALKRQFMQCTCNFIATNRECIETWDTVFFHFISSFVLSYYFFSILFFHFIGSCGDIDSAKDSRWYAFTMHIAQVVDRTISQRFAIFFFFDFQLYRMRFMDKGFRYFTCHKKKPYNME